MEEGEKKKGTRGGKKDEVRKESCMDDGRKTNGKQSWKVKQKGKKTERKARRRKRSQIARKENKQ